MRPLVHVPLLSTFLLLLVFPAALRAGPPPGYYAAAEGKAGAELRQALHTTIRNHTVIPYSSSTRFDTSDALRDLDQDPANTNNIIGIYSRQSEPKASFGLTSGWNREHLWCDSYGLDGREPAYSDLHNLRAEDATVNSARGNKFFDLSDPANSGYRMPASAEALLASTDTDSWEPPSLVKGDIARAMFYMATRYTGDAANEPALYLTDTTGQVTSTTNLMGRLRTLLQWHAADPVDATELARNDRVYFYQSNRNPFVDHPEWVNLMFAPPHPSPPVLSVSCAPPGLTLAWLATNQSTRLEFSTDLRAGWTDVPLVPVLTNGQFRVLWTNTGTGAFFRLGVR